MKTENSKEIQRQLLDRLGDLLNVLGVEIDLDYEIYKGVCPIHAGADNRTAFNFNLRTGRWQCYSHKCHELFKSTLIGFVRGVLSKNKGWCDKGDVVISFEDTRKFIHNFLQSKVTISPVKYKKHAYAVSFADGTITREQVRKTLEIPSPYFVRRGFSEDILDSFDVGECRSFGKRMSNRAVVPIYGFDRKVIGCTGRSLYEECKICQSHHKGDCPDEKYRAFHSKWLHSKGFKRGSWLYNLERASKSIRQTGTMIIVEAPLNVIRLAEAGIENAVALLGSGFARGQKFLIDTCGVYNLILSMDNDTAGHDADEVIRKRCESTYNITSIFSPKNDIAELTVEETKQLFLPILEKANG